MKKLILIIAILAIESLLASTVIAGQVPRHTQLDTKNSDRKSIRSNSFLLKDISLSAGIIYNVIWKKILFSSGNNRDRKDPPFAPLNQGSWGNLQMSQVTSVSELSDVKPNDWAFRALQSLVERYGTVS